jgi:hypothetical protein
MEVLTVYKGVLFGQIPGGNIWRLAPLDILNLSGNSGGLHLQYTPSTNLADARSPGRPEAATLNHQLPVKE